MPNPRQQKKCLYHALDHSSGSVCNYVHTGIAKTVYKTSSTLSTTSTVHAFCMTDLPYCNSNHCYSEKPTLEWHRMVDWHLLRTALYVVPQMSAIEVPELYVWSWSTYIARYYSLSLTCTHPHIHTPLLIFTQYWCSYILDHGQLNMDTDDPVPDFFVYSYIWRPFPLSVSAFGLLFR